MKCNININIKSKGNYPTQANRGLEWGTRELPTLRRKKAVG